VAQIVSGGIVYYAFPVLNPQITAATGWPAGAMTAAFLLGLVVSALAGIRVGRILDRPDSPTRSSRADSPTRSVRGALGGVTGASIVVHGSSPGRLAAACPSR
jgi:hypothetical protein